MTVHCWAHANTGQGDCGELELELVYTQVLVFVLGFVKTTFDETSHLTALDSNPHSPVTFG